MMRFNNMKMLAAAVMASACAFVSCAEMEQQESAVGYLDAPSLEVDVAIEDMTQTKAPDIVISAPSPSEIHYVVKDKDGNVKYDEDGLWTEPLVLPVGAYTVEATYGSNGFGAAYFTGTVSGTIAPLDKDMPALTLSLANSLLCIEVDSEFASHFDVGSSKAVLKSGSSSADVSYGEWIYVPSGADLEVTMSGTTAGKPVSLTHTLSKPSPKAAYNLICRKDSDNWPKITMNEIDASNVWASRAYVTNGAKFSNISEANQKAVVYEAIPTSSSDWSAPVTAVNENGSIVFKGLTPDVTYQARAKVGNILSDNVVEFTPSVDGLSVSAVHTYTSNELDGTDVQTTFSKSDLVKNAISSWTVNICKSDGTVLRSETSVGNSDGSAITSNTGWPYLPVGEGEQYVVKTSATIDGQSFDFAVLDLAVPPTPDFALTLCAYTSYDKYAGENGIIKDLDSDAGANKCDASTLYKAGGKWGVSVNVMSNENYAKKLVIDFDGDKSRTYSVTSFAANEFYENISGCSWTSHQLSVSFTFDNKTVTKTQTHHITGLPYDIDFRNTSEGWNLFDNCSRDAEGLHFDPTATPYANRAFYIPSDLNVSLYLYSGVRLNATSAISVSHLNVKIGSQNNDEVLKAPVKFAGGTTTTTSETQVNGTLKSSSNSIELKTNGLVAGMWVIVPGVRVDYR